MIKKLLIKLLKTFGYHLEKENNVLKGAWLDRLDIVTVLDIGANRGQFAKEIIGILPQARILSFEPIPNIFDDLKNNLKGLNAEAYNYAVGEKKGNIEINISNTDESSSLLGMADLHKDTYSGSSYIDKQEVAMDTLDNLLADKNIKENIFLKIDVQGYEKNVLAGATETLAKTSVIMLESIFNPLYEDQWIFDELLMFLTKNDFVFHGFAEQSLSPKTKIPMFADSIFIHKSKLPLIYK